eukprot:gnl/TRDRNA2_/TRDRNA2_90430_c0_seq2.p1 gnl/TRDRNA2_/TRDRNA2_90430_c0~~gnl/TRDRNA2_/TRDRNA2_90430_c0_seq2.p1  ORF type:complete len:257 (-),score=16.46 gnl/TRDRNA2_/TRDRNA2_90430_c0_seq2:116-850(-)
MACSAAFSSSASVIRSACPRCIASRRRGFSSWVREFVVLWEDVVKSNGHSLAPALDRKDCLVLDQAMYSPNVGGVLRHMPMFGFQMLFLTNSSWPCAANSKSISRFSSTEARYTGKFAKECLRMSMAVRRQKFVARLCIDQHDCSIVLKHLRQRGHGIVALENLETLEEWCEGSPRQPLHSIWDSPLLGDVSQPLCLVLGGESAGLPKDVFKICDAGAYIPSEVGVMACHFPGTERATDAGCPR